MSDTCRLFPPFEDLWPSCLLPSRMQLKKFPDIPVSTREETRVFRHNSRRAPFFPPYLEMRVHVPASSGKESRHSCCTSGGGGLNLKVEKNSRGRATTPKNPDVPTHSRYTCFPCTDSTVTLRIDSKHDGRCDSPVAPQEKATEPYGPPDRKLDTAFPAREESRLAWLHTRQGPDSPVDAPAEPRDTSRPWRGTLRFWPQLQIWTSVPAVTAEEF